MPATLVVPTLNAMPFLPDTLHSIAAQTWPDVETIVVDGGSSDGTVEFLQAWSASHPVRWLSEPDGGQAAAINRGFALARGEIVGWLNADDLLEPRATEVAAGVFSRRPETAFTWGFCLVVDADGTPLYVQNPFARLDLAQLRRHRNFVPQPGSWFRRSLFDRFGTLDESYHYMFDYEYFLRLAGRVEATFVPEIVARFRLHPASKTGRSHRQFLREERRAYRAHGGRLISPFYLDYARYRFVELPMQTLKRPVRWALWKLFGLPAGARLRP